MIASCATSTRRRVRYPEFAVLSAVSARPLRAPCVEMKYWSTDSPSRKFVVMGVSMISPEGLAMRPRMPASCRICWAEPRAPDRGRHQLAVGAHADGRLQVELAVVVRHAHFRRRSVDPVHLVGGDL